ncbi:MAG: hypothetical protein VKP70_05155 [Cyanobacteriota bacterium]|nr:hypothetical protein [Cyanobacteriota bacterium]
MLRLDQFTESVIGYLLKKAEFDLLRELYRDARLALDRVARAAMQEAKDFDGWIGDLALLVANLTMRRWLSLPIDGEDIPMVKELFPPNVMLTYALLFC